MVVVVVVVAVVVVMVAWEMVMGMVESVGMAGKVAVVETVLVLVVVMKMMVVVVVVLVVMSVGCEKAKGGRHAWHGHRMRGRHCGSVMRGVVV